MIRAPAISGVLAVVMLLSLVKPAWPQDDRHSSIAIVLRPSAEPIPALKYRLLPERGSLVPGNAAVFYHRAIEMLEEARQAARRDKQPGNPLTTEELASGEWMNCPLESIPLERARQWLDTHRGALVETKLGAQRQTCNWEFDLRSEGVEMLLPEIQKMRSLIWLVALKTRLAVREHKLDEAIDWLQIGYAMARHVSEGPFLLQGLVGVSLSGVMAKPLEDLIQAPGAPNLFWALAHRPRPFIDLATAAESERFLLEREIPQLRELDSEPWSQEKARAFTEEMRNKLFRLAGYVARSHADSGSSGVEEWSSKLGLAALVAQAYPEAKVALVAQGRSLAQVEAMPVVQVAALHTFQMYQQVRDEEFKWVRLPYYQAFKGMNRSFSRGNLVVRTKPLLRLFTLLTPGITSILMAQVMVDRRLDAMQCIEAIRIYGAAHGKLPAGLEDISEAPVPVDVATGLPFGYRVQGNHAVLSAPSPPGRPDIPQYTIKYELEWAR
jgi:hypothetical protein